MQCLQPAKIASKSWESDRKASLHEVIKQLFNMKMALEDLANTPSYVSTFARNFLKQIQKRFKNCGTTNSLLNIAHFLDPAEKGCVLKVFGVYEQTIEAIKEMAKKYDPPPIQAPEMDQTAPAGAEESSRPLTGTERLRMRQKLPPIHQTFSQSLLVWKLRSRGTRVFLLRSAEIPWCHGESIKGLLTSSDRLLQTSSPSQHRVHHQKGHFLQLQGLARSRG